MRCGNCNRSQMTGLNRYRCWVEWGICGTCAKEERRQQNKSVPKKICIVCESVLPKYKSKYCSFECLSFQSWKSPERKKIMRLRYL